MTINPLLLPKAEERIGELEVLRFQLLQALQLGHTEAMGRILEEDLPYIIEQLKKSV